MRNPENSLTQSLILNKVFAGLAVGSTLVTNTVVTGAQVTTTVAVAATTTAPMVIEMASSSPVVQEVKKKVEENVEKLTALGVPYSTSIARELSDYYASKWGVSAEKMWSVIKCENRGLNPKKQSEHRYNAGQIARHPDWGEVGDRERSFGLVQIHLPSNPQISYAQATDPDFSLNFLAQRMSEGKGRLWSCW